MAKVRDVCAAKTGGKFFHRDALCGADDGGSDEIVEPRHAAFDVRLGHDAAVDRDRGNFGLDRHRGDGGRYGGTRNGG